MSPKTPSPLVDPEISTDEIELAADETPTEAMAPELNAETEDLEEWDTPSDAAGHEVPKSALEDEVSATEQLIEEGLDEAERDRRLAAADPEFEP